MGSTKTCAINGNHMTKFNGQSLDIPDAMTKRGLLLALDASNFHRFIVYARSQIGKWETVVILKNNEVEINPVSSKVLVNNRPVQITTGKPVIAKDISGQPIATQTVTSQCVLSKPELEVASWMIPSSSSSSVSSSVPSHLMSELKKETEMCSKVMVQPTKVAKAYKAATGRCTILRHLTEQLPGKMCFSKVPVTQCGPSCKSQGSEMTVKTVPFTCLPLGRQAKHYMTKVQRGE